MRIRDMHPDDWPAVSKIYEEGLATKDATFEQSVPTWEIWDRTHNRNCRLVAIIGKQVEGWAALSPVSGRAVYRGVCEVSVYVSQAAQGQGVGSRLLDGLILRSEEAGVWTLQASIFPENKISIHMHKRKGFREVGRREKIGQMDGVWRDTILLERRSDRI